MCMTPEYCTCECEEDYCEVCGHYLATTQVERMQLELFKANRGVK